jgi:hypothetical protein
MPVTRAWGLSAVFAVILTAGITGSFRLPSPDALPHCMNSALAAFQTALSPEEVASIWKDLGDKAPKSGQTAISGFRFYCRVHVFFSCSQPSVGVGPFGPHRSLALL